MKPLLILALMCCILGSGCAQDPDVIFDDRFSEVRELIIEQVEDGIVPSIAVAVAEDGDIIWEEGFGWSDVENRIQATPHTMYRLGSITKTITATGLMLLVEEGRVDLDKPAVEYLPKDVRPRAYVGEPGDVTVRHLVNHRSGMPAYAESFYEDDPEGPRSLGETVRRYGIIVYPPGWSFIYCNLGYQMLGSIIAEVSGMSYAGFIEEQVFAPLGMTESLVYRGQAMDEAYAVNYTQAFERIPLYVDVYPGADGNCASAHDLIRFAMFHLEDHLPDQEAILTDESIRSMQAAVPPANTRYGIGWDLDASERGFSSVCHGGEGPGVDAFMRLFPTEDIAAVILCNAECEKLYDIQKAIFVALIPELGEPEPVQSEPVEPEAVEPEAAGESPGSEAPAEPTGMYGTWSGRIEAYDREIELDLAIDSEGARVAVGDQPQDDMEVWVLSPTFLLGMFDASIPTADNERYPYRNRLAVVRDGDRLYGAVISVGWRDGRAGHYELSSHVELQRLTQN